MHDSSGILSRYSLNTIKNAIYDAKIAISDFDGTIYEGKTGYIALDITERLFLEKPYKIFLNLKKILGLLPKTTRYLIVKDNLSYFTNQVMDFIENLFHEKDIEYLEKVMEKVIYIEHENFNPEFSNFVKKKDIKKIYVVSQSLEELISVAIKKWEKYTKIPTEIFANKFKLDDENRIVGIDYRILNREDKGKASENIIEKLKNSSETLLGFGDSYEDLIMLSNISNNNGISILKTKYKRTIREAIGCVDVIINDWKKLDELLEDKYYQKKYWKINTEKGKKIHYEKRKRLTISKNAN